jgi:hypothetical protein
MTRQWCCGSNRVCGYLPTGIAFAVLYAAALLMVPTLPGINKPGYDIVSHVNEHSDAMRMQAL